MVEMAQDLVNEAADHNLKLARFFGIGCPGPIDAHGVISQGGQNLPGNWEGDGFKLAQELARRLPHIHGHEPFFVIHNDAVVQGLSEVPAMQEFQRWGIFTIGTGLGNAASPTDPSIKNPARRRQRPAYFILTEGKSIR